MLTLMLDMKMLREAKRFVTVGGKGVMERRRSLGRWRTAAAGLPLLFVLLGVAIPLLTLFLSTIMILPAALPPITSPSPTGLAMTSIPWLCVTAFCSPRSSGTRCGTRC
jgi:ABC-type Fe3+ transport system permease subunit